MAVELNVQYAIRLLAAERTEETAALFSRLFRIFDSEAIRRDIILAMASWGEWVWLSDLKSSFRGMRPGERRAFIIASFKLKDEGRHWRQSMKGEFSEFETITREWMSDRVSTKGWNIPL